MPIRCDLALGDDIPHAFLPLTNREIFRALIKQDLVSVQSSAIMQCAEGFPGRLASRADINLLKQLSTLPIYRNVLDAFYQGNTVAAAANSRPSQNKYETHRLSEITETESLPDHIADVMRHLEEAQASVVNLQGLGDLFSPAQLTDVMDGMKNTIECFMKRTEEVGSANALAEHLGADPTDRATLRKPIDLLIQQHTFGFSVRQVLAAACGNQDPLVINDVAGKIKLEDCPGTWLKYAVRLQMRKAMSTDHPSNYYDLEHLAYLPYVDMLFADKRLATFTRQVLNSDDLPSSLKGVRPPISVPNSIDSLEMEISSLSSQA